MFDDSKKQSRMIRFSWPVLIGLLILVSCHHLRAQPQDSLAVIIQNVATDGSSLRGYSANYPYPILSFISILDKDDRPVRGLADTLRWLSPGDVANNGEPIPSIWQPILDYTTGEPTPTQTDIYKLRPEPNFIEICESCQPIVPTTTMLLMDVSGSINSIPNALDSAKAGLTRFISDMRPEDRAGVIQFNCEFKHLPPTNDKQALIDFVQSAQTGPWTPLYEAIINAIDSMKDESAIRRSIVVYTDGKNNLPKNLRDCRQIQRPMLNEDSVIVVAKKFQIPVYMIALANSASETILKRIASETGGHFYKTEDGASFGDIYKKISDIIQNFYVMAHISPRPCESEFERTVDITVTDSPANLSRSGRGTREYSVNGPPRLHDLRLRKTADRDTVFRGDEITFTLTIENHGNHAAFNISLRDSLSEHLRFTDGPGGDAKVRSWQFDSLPQQQTVQVSYTAIVSDAVTDSIKELSNFAKVTGACDSDSTNDSANLRLTVFKRKPYDLSILKTANEDAVNAGETITYNLSLSNRGPNTAFNITVRDTLPEFLTPIDVDSVQSNILFWRFDSLRAGQNLDIAYQATVANPLPSSPIELNNVARVFAAGDTNAANNSASAKVIAENGPPRGEKYDLSIQKSASEDSVEAGDVINYSLAIRNLGPNAAFDIAVRDTLPDFLTPIDVDSVQGNILFWRIDSLLASQNMQIVYQARVDSLLPKPPTHLINVSRVFAENDSNAANNADSFTVIARRRTKPLKPYDLAIQKQADRDTVLAGEIISYTLTLSNLGPNDAGVFQVTDILPEFLTPIDVDTTQGNLLMWRVDSLAALQSVNLVYHARVQNPLPRSPLELINSSRIWAGVDTNVTNNTARDTVIAKNGPPLVEKKYDLSIQKAANPDSVTSGEEITYTITVRNLGPNTAFEIAVHDTLPDYLTPVDAGSAQDNVLFWEFDSLRASQTVNLVYHGRVDDPLPVSPAELVNIARVFAANDSNAANNSASARVIAANEVVPACADISVTISIDKDSVKIGEEFSCALIIRNFGPTTAFDIVAQVTIPEFVTPFDFESQQGNELFWRLDSLRAGDDETIVFSGRLNSTPSTNSRLGLTARVSSDCSDDDSNNISTAFVTAVTIFEDCSLFHLDANVFAPDRRPLGIIFELGEPRVVRLDVYDLASYHVTQITELSFPAGENRFEWNGSAANGQKVGSGVYVISLRSDNLLCWKKVIVVR